MDEGKQRLEHYIKAVDREINKRRQVIELLTHGSKYYESLLGEANIVANVSFFNYLLFVGYIFINYRFKFRIFY